MGLTSQMLDSQRMDPVEQIDPGTFPLLEMTAIPPLRTLQLVPIDLGELDLLLGPVHSDTWQDELRDTLDALRWQMSEAAEDRCQFFDGIETVAPHLTPVIARLESERRTIAAEIDELCHQMTMMSPVEIARFARTIWSRVGETLESEDDIVQEAFWRDMGGG